MSAPKQYGVLNLIWDIRDAHSICRSDATAKGDPTAKAILWALASRCSPEKGFTCWPSLELIAGDVATSVRNVREHMQRLLDEGLIHRSRRYDDSYIYVIAIEKIKKAAAEQRAKWEAERAVDAADSPDSDEGRAFAKTVAANKAIVATVPSTVTPVAEDATFRAGTGLDYTTALTQALMASDTIASLVSEPEARKLAEAICREIPGSAPVIAMYRLDAKTLSKVASKDSPCGYLRSVLRSKVKELDGQECELVAEEKLTNWLPQIKGSFAAPINWHPRQIDDMVNRVRVRSGGVIGAPVIQGEGMVFSLSMPESPAAPKHVISAGDYLDEELE